MVKRGQATRSLYSSPLAGKLATPSSAVHGAGSSEQANMSDERQQPRDACITPVMHRTFTDPQSGMVTRGG